MNAALVFAAGGIVKGILNQGVEKVHPGLFQRRYGEMNSPERRLMPTHSPALDSLRSFPFRAV